MFSIPRDSLSFAFSSKAESLQTFSGGSCHLREFTGGVKEIWFHPRALIAHAQRGVAVLEQTSIAVQAFVPFFFFFTPYPSSDGDRPAARNELIHVTIAMIQPPPVK